MWHVESEFPDLGSNSHFMRCKCGVLTTQLPGKSLKLASFNWQVLYHFTSLTSYPLKTHDPWKMIFPWLIEIFQVWNLLIPYFWYNWACSSLLYTSCTLAVISRGLIRFSFMPLGNCRCCMLSSEACNVWLSLFFFVCVACSCWCSLPRILICGCKIVLL